MSFQADQMFIDKTSQRQIQVITWPNELNIAQVEKKLTTDVKKHHSSSDKIQDPILLRKKNKQPEVIRVLFGQSPNN